MTKIYPILQKINHPKDFKWYNLEQLNLLSIELRQYLIDVILEYGGHFAANLGVVELTVALHYVFDIEHNHLVWDVGHQSYAHKVLTGRRDELVNIRKLNGIGGFPKISESIFDHFGTGHSSTSISAALGFAMADKLLKNSNSSIAVIGDGALTAGQSYEALNNAGLSDSNILIIINDNNIGIDPNHGSVNEILKSEHNSQSFFEQFGFQYYFLEDGHNLSLLIDSLKFLKNIQVPRVLHIRTIKGKGFLAAETAQTKWHATSQYVKINAEKGNHIKFQDVFGKKLLSLANNNDKILGVTPAMPTGSSMNLAMQAYPNRFFDVGIAEQHAITFSAAMVLKGFKVFCNIYSTFLQRAYDQWIHDVCLQNIPLILCIDRAGNVGEDGPTHHGIYDLSFLIPIPNVLIAAPFCQSELEQVMELSLNVNQPIAIRYPKGDAPQYQIINIDLCKAINLKKGKKIAILSTGAFTNTALQVADLLAEQSIDISVYHFGFVKPLDTALLLQIHDQYHTIITLEDGSINGGFGSLISQYLHNINSSVKIINLGYQDRFIEQGSRSEIINLHQLDANSIVDRIINLI